MAWETQGAIAKRELEHLGTTDQGVILFRQILKRELQKIADGLDPLGTVRDPAKNQLIAFAIEKDKVHFSDGFDRLMMVSPAKYSPFADELRELFAGFNADKLVPA
jgi:5,5'-dehydrodivanillate O-demethylase